MYEHDPNIEIYLNTLTSIPIMLFLAGRAPQELRGRSSSPAPVFLRVGLFALVGPPKYSNILDLGPK